MVENALLDVRVLPWRPRAHVMKPDTLREGADLFGWSVDDLTGVIVSLAWALIILIGAPVIVLLLAALLLSIELPIVLGLAVIILVVRFAGLLPWTVVIVNAVTGEERCETYRALWRAVGRIRDINHDRRVRVRWAWA